DVGANIGIMTYHLAKCFPSKKIIAIEPIPSSFAISKRIKDNFNLSNVEILCCAVGEQEEELEMVLPIDGKVRMQGLAHVVHDSIDKWNEGERIKVRSRKIDTIVGKERIAGIKMDIENYEYFALKGAQKILERDQPVIYLELWKNKNRDRCFEFLEELGYKIFINQKNTLVPYKEEKHQNQNFIFKVDQANKNR
ncbi:MAG: FkbM family methyltransferase, partial [Desulfobacteraceae bacterium]|nr:FkbM family methyltransferase [Desulfobacteraceae bacterium]